MLRSLLLFSLVAVVPQANAQSAPANPQPQADPSQPPAPIVRRYQQSPAPPPGRHQAARIVESQPISGVWLRWEPASKVETVSATAQLTEIRLERGVLNVNVHQPAEHCEILIDLPGGQTSLLKDGLYTFNADTNTVRVLRGEAAYLGTGNGANPAAKPIKIKEDHQISLVAAPGKSELKPVEAYPYELTSDLLPPDGDGDRGYGEPDYPRYAGDYLPYGPYPYYAGFYGYPYGFYPGFYGYPFAYGIGIGYYGGFHGGYGYRGGFRR